MENLVGVLGLLVVILNGALFVHSGPAFPRNAFEGGIHRNAKPAYNTASGPREREAPPNFMLRLNTFPIINDMKERADKACGFIVSCTDITALTARDSVSKVCGMVNATQTPESGKNTTKWSQLAKVERFSLMVRGLRDGRGEKIWAGQCKQFNEQVCGMVYATQTPESGKNTNKWLQLAKVERFTLMVRGPNDGQGEKIWAGQCKRFNEQRSVGTMDRVVKRRTLLQSHKPKPDPRKPKPDPGHSAHHH